jgi:AcrR family transcriptional regulator
MAAKKQRRVKAKNGEGRIRTRNQRIIMRAAIKVFAKKGYDGTRISEIAKVSGLPKPNVYYYFKTKDAIYKAIIRDILTAWDEALEELDASRDPGEAIAGYIRAKLEYSRKHTDESKIFANESARGAPLLTPANIRHMKEHTWERERVFRAWIEAGRMDPVNIQHLFIMLWATTQFYADVDAMARAGLDTRALSAGHFEQAEQTIVRIVLKGCGIDQLAKVAQKARSRARK